MQLIIAAVCCYDHCVIGLAFVIDISAEVEQRFRFLSVSQIYLVAFQSIGKTRYVITLAAFINLAGLT